MVNIIAYVNDEDFRKMREKLVVAGLTVTYVYRLYIRKTIEKGELLYDRKNVKPYKYADKHRMQIPLQPEDRDRLKEILRENGATIDEFVQAYMLEILKGKKIRVDITMQTTEEDT